MSGIEVAGVVLGAVPLLLYAGTGRTLTSIVFFVQNYGLVGVFICTFGSREVWRIQVQILSSTKDSDVMDFKRSAQDDSNIIAVASTILAQVAITALPLNDLSRAHWVARAFFTFSLVSSIMAVYYATSQYRTLGRCLRAEQVKGWIRSTGPVHRKMKFLVGDHSNMPSAAAVLNMSAPNMLLSFSLNAFLIGLGVYLGYVWTRNLDELAGAKGSRDVFTTYLVGLVVCYCIYALSRAVVADQSYVSENDWVLKYRPTDYSPDTEERERKHEMSAVINGRRVAIALKQRPTIGLVMSRTKHEPDIEQAQSPDASLESSSRQMRHESTFEVDNTRKELLHIFQEAAKLRKASGEVDQRLVRLLEKLGEDEIASS